MNRILFAFVLMAIVCSVLFSQAKRIRVPQDWSKIQLAINAANNGDTVLVDEGIYFENILLKKKIVLGSRFILDGDTAHISKTILDGSQPKNSDSASVLLLTIGTDSTTVISGFTIQRGRGTRIYDPTYWDASWWGGGGICIYAGGARISHNDIRYDTLISFEGVFGGGITIWTQDGPISYWIIEHNRIHDNVLSSTTTHGGAEGGGIHLTEDGRFVDNIVMNNSAIGTNYGTGGGIIVATAIGYGNTNILLANNYISGNLTSHWGGGIVAAIDPYELCIPYLTFENNIISKNTASVLGGACHFQGGDYTFVNNTIVDNVSPEAIEGTSARGTLTMRLLNNIIWNPRSTNEFSWGGGSYPKYIAMSYSDVRGGFTGTGNINSDPLFIPNDSLYRLANGSPCFGSGEMSASVGGVTLNAPQTDFLGLARPRPISTKPDHGAIEQSNTTDVKRSVADQQPTSYGLSQNYPNPFNPTTVISYQLPVTSLVRMSIHDLLGREVAVLVNEQKPAGMHQANWNAAGFASGIYFYQMKAGEYAEIKQMILLK